MAGKDYIVMHGCKGQGLHGSILGFFFSTVIAVVAHCSSLFLQMCSKILPYLLFFKLKKVRRGCHLPTLSRLFGWGGGQEFIFLGICLGVGVK